MKLRETVFTHSAAFMRKAGPGLRTPWQRDSVRCFQIDIDGHNVLLVAEFQKLIALEFFINYSTVTDLARLRGLSISHPRSAAM